MVEINQHDYPTLSNLINWEIVKARFSLTTKIDEAITSNVNVIPHPKFDRIVGYGEVALIRKPLNPDDGEQIVNVEVVAIDEAIRILEGSGRYDIAELYKMAHQIRESFESITNVN